MNERRGFLASLLAIPALLLGRGNAAAGRQVTLRAAAPLKRFRHPKLRVWNLGSLDHKLFPTEKAIERLAKELQKWGGESDMDLIWGPDLTVTQFDLGPGDIDVINTEPAIRIIRQTAPHPEDV